MMKKINVVICLIVVKLTLSGKSGLKEYYQEEETYFILDDKNVHYQKSIGKPGFNLNEVDEMKSPFYQSKGNVVHNLNKVVHEFGKTGCLLLIDNFKNNNLRQSLFPVIVRQPKPIVNHYFDYKFVWVTKTPNDTGRWSDLYSFLNKRFTSFLQGDKHFHSSQFFTEIRFEYFTKSSKPWKCQVQLLIQPLFYSNFPKVFFNYYRHGSLVTRLFEKVWKLNIIISEHGDSRELNVQQYLNWKKADKSYKVAFAIFRTKNVVLGDPVKAIISDSISILSKFYVCKLNHKTNMVSPDIIVASLEKKLVRPELSSQFKLFTKMGFITIDDTTIWSLTKDENKADPLYTQTSERLNLGDCYERYEAGRFQNCSLRNFKLQYNQNWVTKIHSHIWQFVLSNFTFVDSNNYNKVFWNVGIKSSKSQSLRIEKTHRLILARFKRTYEKGPAELIPNQEYQIVIAENLQNLKFVSCGERGKEPLAFKELVNVFDRYVWIFIFGSSICVLTLLSRRNIDLWKHILECLKIILGLDSLIMDKAVCYERFILSGFLLAAIVLNNAYKNDNVYNVVQPIKPKLYETFMRSLYSVKNKQQLNKILQSSSIYIIINNDSESN